MKRTLNGQFAKELDNAVMIKFWTDYKDKDLAREKALREGKKLGTKMREIFLKWLYKKP